MPGSAISCHTMIAPERCARSPDGDMAGRGQLWRLAIGSWMETRRFRCRADVTCWGGCPLRPASYDAIERHGGAIKEESLSDVHVLAIDLAKRSFQVCTTDRVGAVLFNRTVSRTRLMQMLSSRAPCIIAMEACTTSHSWGRVAQSCGHDVRLIPPVYAKPFCGRTFTTSG
jgi:hypothetical protein